MLRDQVFDQHVRDRVLVGAMKQPAEQKQAEEQGQNRGNDGGSPLNRLGDNRVAVALLCDLSPLLLQGIALLVDA